MGWQDKEDENPREGCDSGRLQEGLEGSNPGQGPKNAKTRGLGEADPQNAANALPNETRAGRGGGDKKRKEKGAAAAAPAKT